MTVSYSPRVQLDLHRHPIKSGEFLTTQANPEENIALPLEGLIQAQEAAVEFAEEFSQAPEGTVVFGLTSNAPRTQEAGFIFDMELEAISKKLGSGVVVLDLEGKMPDESTKARVDQAIDEQGNKNRVVLVNGPIHEGLGIRDYDVAGYESTIEELGSEEKLITEWSRDGAIGDRIGVQYEEVFQGYIQLEKDIRKIQADIFPDREMWVKAFGHSAEIEVALATWAGRNVDEIIKLAGGNVINFMEKARLEIDVAGDRTVQYRGTKLKTALYF